MPVSPDAAALPEAEAEAEALPEAEALALPDPPLEHAANTPPATIAEPARAVPFRNPLRLVEKLDSDI